MEQPFLEQLQQTLNRQMPITLAMGIEVVDWVEDRLSMRMPLEANRNHQYSAFAGSLNSLCTLVGWGTLFMLLRRKGLAGNIVIRRGNVRYFRPVFTSEFIARSRPIDPEELDYFFQLLEGKGKSKIDLAVEIADAQGAYVIFKGSYVVQSLQPCE